MSPDFDPRSPQGALAIPSDRGTLVITGKDRQTWLNGLVTCDLAPLKLGQGAYGLAVSKVGRILGDVIVVAAEDRLLVSVPRERAAALVTSFDTYLVMEDAELADASDDYAWTLLHGPSSDSVARAVASSIGAVSGAVDLTGLGGAALITKRSISASESLLANGAALGDDAAWELLRVERAIPSWGIDFDEKTYPQEASLEKRAVSFQKGCYLGQEVVCRLEMRGHVHRKLVALVLDGGVSPAVGTAITDAAESDGASIGTVTSSATSPHLHAPIALAMVKYAFADAGRTLSIEGRRATVVDVPVS